MESLESKTNLSLFLFLPHIFFIIDFTALQFLRGSGNPYVKSLNSSSQWGNRFSTLIFQY